MNMKYMAIPDYESVDIVAKTTEAITGTIDRKLVGRALLTLQAGFTAKHQVVDGDGTPIVTVKKIGDGDGEIAAPELFVRLVGNIKSLASYKFFEGYVADNRENAGVVDLFTEDAVQVGKIVDTAKRMCAAHPECDSQWEIVDGDGKRYFLRKVCSTLNANGKIDD